MSSCLCVQYSVHQKVLRKHWGNILSTIVLAVILAHLFPIADGESKYSILSVQQVSYVVAILEGI